jgi:hypothetical protein
MLDSLVVLGACFFTRISASTFRLSTAPDHANSSSARQYLWLVTGHAADFVFA